MTNSQVYEDKFGAFLTHKSGNQVASFTAIPKGARLYDTGSENPKERILVGQDLSLIHIFSQKIYPSQI